MEVWGQTTVYINTHIKKNSTQHPLPLQKETTSSMSAVVAVFPSGSMVSYEVSKSLLYEKYVKCLMGISSNNPHCDPSDHDSFNIIVWNAPHMEDSLLKWASFWQNLPERPTHLVPTNDMAVCWAARMREENVFGNDGLKIMAPPSMYRPK